MEADKAKYQDDEPMGESVSIEARGMHCQGMTPPLNRIAEHCAVFLDFDGTLLNLVERPDQVVVDGCLLYLLDELYVATAGATAVISGRSIDYLDALFSPLRLPAAGLHGVERRKASGIMHGASFVDTQLTEARAAVNALVQAQPGTSVEDKGRTLAVHFRMAPQCEAAVRQALTDIVKPLGPNYHIQEGSMVLEIKPRGFTKATAIKAFMQEPPFSGRQPVFVGDDLTDQEGFKMVEDQGGISIAVGDRVTGQFHFDTVSAVRRWLQEIAALHDSHRE